MTLYIDADGCNTKTRIILQHYVKRGVTVFLVSNRTIKTENTLVKTHITHIEKDSTDIYIILHVQKNDLVITRDLALAKALLKKDIFVISDYGEIYHKATIDGRILRAENNKEIRTIHKPSPKKTIIKRHQKRIHAITAFIDKWILDNSAPHLS